MFSLKSGKYKTQNLVKILKTSIYIYCNCQLTFSLLKCCKKTLICPVGTMFLFLFVCLFVVFFLIGKGKIFLNFCFVLFCWFVLFFYLIRVSFLLIQIVFLKLIQDFSDFKWNIFQPLKGQHLATLITTFGICCCSISYLKQNKACNSNFAWISKR